MASKHLHSSHPDTYVSTMESMITKFQMVIDSPVYSAEVKHPAQANIDALRWAIDYVRNGPPKGSAANAPRRRGPNAVRRRGPDATRTTVNANRQNRAAS